MKQIYLDHGATTPVRIEVLESMLPYWTEYYGNPSSIHRHGQMASQGLEIARQQIATQLGCSPNEIIFTGCGSESDNLALRGVMWAARTLSRGNHLITSSVEHKAVLSTAFQLQRTAGFEITVLPVNKYGQIEIDQLEAAIRPETVLISIMAANNEIGSFQPYIQIGEIAKARGIIFHSDAVQAFAFHQWNLSKLPIDLMSIAPHKFYGPKGIGILYAKAGIDLIPSLTGGSQEEGRRAGTVNVPFAVGAATAIKLAFSEQAENIAHSKRLVTRLIDGILNDFGDSCVLTGHPSDRLPNHASFAFRDLSGNDLVRHLDLAGISASSGSACLTGDPQPSMVLQALGLDEEWTQGGLRLTVGRQNTMSDIEYTLATLPDVVDKIQKLGTIFVS